MGQLVGCIRGIGEACRALDFPVVSGNVSLYNETNGKAILPTPTIGGVGLLEDFTKSMTLAFKAEGEAILLIGETQGLARPVALSARHLRAGGGRAAAGRSRRRKPQWRFRARADRRGPVDGGARCFRRRPSGGAGRDGDGVGHRRRARGAAPACPRMPSGSARTRRAMWSRSEGCRRPSRAAPRRRRCRCAGSAPPAAAFSRLTASGRCRSLNLRRASRRGCRPTWQRRRL